MALRGIREVTDKNKHILLEAIFNADFIPDHLLPVGIHRCGQQRWRAHLCTVGLKFSGPPRDNVRDACEDRRKFCEENGVNFVLYGKQTHAKGPIGSRPTMPTTFPRLSDYVTSISRSSTSGGSSGNSQMILGALRNNAAMRQFFSAIENGQKVLKARKAEAEGSASYVVTPAHAALHKRIIEDALDQKEHAFCGIKRQKRACNAAPMFALCPIRIQHGSTVIKFVFSVRDEPTNYEALVTYLESILCNAQPPMSDRERKAFIASMVETIVAPQIHQFMKVNERIAELTTQFDSLLSAIKALHQSNPIAVHTRKGNVAAVTAHVADPTNPMITVPLTPIISVEWNALTPDSVAAEYANELENEQDQVIACDILFAVLEASARHRQGLFLVPNQPPVAPKKPAAGRANGQSGVVAPVSDEDLSAMWEACEGFEDDLLSECVKVMNNRANSGRR